MVAKAEKLSAQDLVGHRLDTKDWIVVVGKVERSPCATGGNYSYGYSVDDGNGNLAFLKAFDFHLLNFRPIRRGLFKQ